MTPARAPPEAREVTPIDAAETTVARAVLGRLGHGGYVVGGSGYDANAAFDAAGAAGYGLRTAHPEASAGKGHHRQSPRRLASIQVRGTELSKGLVGRAGRSSGSPRR